MRWLNLRYSVNEFIVFFLSFFDLIIDQQLVNDNLSDINVEDIRRYSYHVAYIEN